MGRLATNPYGRYSESKNTTNVFIRTSVHHFLSPSVTSPPPPSLVHPSKNGGLKLTSFIPRPKTHTYTSVQFRRATLQYHQLLCRKQIGKRECYTQILFDEQSPLCRRPGEDNNSVCHTNTYETALNHPHNPSINRTHTWTHRPTASDRFIDFMHLHIYKFIAPSF